MNKYFCCLLCKKRGYPHSRNNSIDVFWCTTCGCAVPVEDADFKNNVHYCPCCKQQLREKARFSKINA